MRGVMSKVKLQQLFTRRLRLTQPEFRLERIGTKLAGSIISATFKGKSARQRQKMIWDALDAELGDESVHEVGTILTYSPEEWNIDLPDAASAEVG
jgi:acid stress-induced BolA-like protein IbaG/YrbA